MAIVWHNDRIEAVFHVSWRPAPFDLFYMRGYLAWQKPANLLVAWEVE